jgi:hypothetical protein
MTSSLTWEERNAKIEAAFRKLLMVEGAGPRIPYAQTIPYMGRHLLIEAGFGPDADPVPRFQPASSSETERELANVRKHAVALADALDNLHAPAVEILADWERHPGTVVMMLRVLSVIIDFAEIPDGMPKRPKPQKMRATKAARLAATHHWRLTRQEPSVIWDDTNQKKHGPYVDFLTEIFAALSIDASVPDQIRKLKAWEDAPWRGEVFSSKSAQ